MYSIKFTVIHFHSAVLSRNPKNATSYWQGHIAPTDKLQRASVICFFIKKSATCTCEMLKPYFCVSSQTAISLNPLNPCGKFS